MQASICFPSSPFFPAVQSAKTFSKMLLPTNRIRTSKSISIRAASAASDTPEVDYSSMASSVFPAEACDTVGGVACDVEMFPETKLREEPKAKAKAKAEAEAEAGGTKQGVDREYVEYNSPKTVFIAEACDDLGGEFCEPAYQSGVN